MRVKRIFPDTTHTKFEVLKIIPGRNQNAEKRFIVYNPFFRIEFRVINHSRFVVESNLKC